MGGRVGADETVTETPNRQTSFEGSYLHHGCFLKLNRRRGHPRQGTELEKDGGSR